MNGFRYALHDLIFPSSLRGYISAGVLREAIPNDGKEMAPHHLCDDFMGKSLFETLITDVLVKMLQFDKAAGSRTGTPLGEFIKVMLGCDGVQSPHEALERGILWLAEEERHGTLSKGCIEGGKYLPRTRRAFVGQ